MLASLPILVAMSLAQSSSTGAAPKPAPAPQQAVKPAQAAETVTCPITGERIPSCCCPVKK